MALLRHLKLLATVVPLVVASVIVPAPQNVHKRAPEDDDDTPLPVVIWHGMDELPFPFP